jgi:hypothetical protein
LNHGRRGFARGNEVGSRGTLILFSKSAKDFALGGVFRYEERNSNPNMKKIICLALGLLAIHLAPVFGQQSTSTFAQRVAAAETVKKEAAASASPLTKFNLDFPGGPPKELVAAIEKATGKPLNVIIPDEFADTKLPSLKMEKVDVVQLFAALGAASHKQENRITRRSGLIYGGDTYTTENTAYGFKTEGNPSDNSIWYFYVQNPPPPPDFSKPVPVPAKIVKFYPLSSYLDSGLTVDDITTAIQTGWKMSGDNSPPELNYHKETKLLMAYGEPDKLKVIEDVLVALQPRTENSVINFGQRLQNVINNSPRAVATPPRFALPPNTPSTLSPEAQAILIEQNREQSTNLPTEKTGK